MVAAFDDYARLCRNNVQCPQREIIHPGVRDREHGWPSARRVLADAHVQKTRRPHRESRGEVMKNKRSIGAMECCEAEIHGAITPSLHHSITPFLIMEVQAITKNVRMSAQKM